MATPSIDRRPPFCKHASSCGGCAWQHMHYEKQLFYKESWIRDLFAPFGSGPISSMIPCSQEVEYRNKMEYTFSQNKEGTRFLGLLMAARKGKVEDLSECHLTSPLFMTVLHAVKAWWTMENEQDSEHSSPLLAFHPLKETGSLRTLTLREGKRTQQFMVMLTVSGNPDYALSKQQIQRFSSTIQHALAPALERGELLHFSVFLRVQQAIRGQETQFYEMHLSGSDHIQEEIQIQVGDYKRVYRFKISPTAFFQPNSVQASVLYSKALEIAGCQGKRKRVLDLYAGTATLGLVFAPFAEQVISIELNPYAVFDARVNQEINGVENIEILFGDVAQVLEELQRKDPSFTEVDLVVLDPPRTGLLPQAIEVVLKANPKEVLYISCAPAKQACDIQSFLMAGYEIMTVQPIDQFPQTVHVENIVFLRKK
ncbi:MAG: 23S rRNA (uracil(1939)-C(5))-methyltransferase RlmD [Chlamydiae bacterium]|nr:23S rRNA (uracil(1939)-C(5))-methyltransferase RlmD [Chlamydiota bacterium]